MIKVTTKAVPLAVHRGWLVQFPLGIDLASEKALRPVDAVLRMYRAEAKHIPSALRGPSVLFRRWVSAEAYVSRACRRLHCEVRIIPVHFVSLAPLIEIAHGDELVEEHLDYLFSREFLKRDEPLVVASQKMLVVYHRRDADGTRAVLQRLAYGMMRELDWA